MYAIQRCFSTAEICVSFVLNVQHEISCRMMNDRDLTIQLTLALVPCLSIRARA